MPMLSHLAPIWIAYFFAAATPGPSQIFILECVSFASRRHGRMAGLGVSLGTFVWVALVAFGLGTLVRSFEHGPAALRWGSAALLAYFLARTVRKILAKPTDPAESGRIHESARDTLGATFVKGLMVNLINPNSVVFFLSLFAPMLVAEHDPRALAACVAGVMVISVAWYQLLVTVSGHPLIQSALFRSEKFMRIAFAGFYLYFLVKLLA